MQTNESRAHGALDAMFREESVLDLYSWGRWQVPDGLVAALTERVDALAEDPRAALLVVDEHPDLRTPVPALVADVLGITAFLCGDVAVRSGSLLRLEHDLVRSHHADAAGGRGGPGDPYAGWVAPAAPWRPPGGELFRAAGDDRGLRRLAWELTVEILRALAGIESLETRRQALLKLYDHAAADHDLVEATLSAPSVPSGVARLREHWADAAEDDLVAELPELTGNVGYLSWIVDGWCAAHELLAAAVPGGDDLCTASSRLLVQAGLTTVPPELAVGVRGDLYAQVGARLPDDVRTWDATDWRGQVRSWLARALVAGEFDAARTWLDLAVRLTGVVQGLPGDAVTPEPCVVPVGEFQDDVRRLFRVRRVRHPLTGVVAAPTWLATEDVFPPVGRSNGQVRGTTAGGPDPAEGTGGEESGPGESGPGEAPDVASADAGDRSAGSLLAPADGPACARGSALAQATAMIDRIVGQPALVAVLRELVDMPAQDLRLLVTGPPDVGTDLAVDVLARLMTLRGFDGTAVWLHHEQFALLDADSAVAQLRDRVEGCDGERLIAIDGLDRLVSYERIGQPLAQELHRLISAHGAQVQLVAFGGPDGYRRLVHASPSLAAWWRVVRTREFAAGDFAVLFGRALDRRGATTTPDALLAAGDLLAATRASVTSRSGSTTGTEPGEAGRYAQPVDEVHNAGLATRLADLTVAAARRRTNWATSPVVDVVDLPADDPEPAEAEPAETEPAEAGSGDAESAGAEAPRHVQGAELGR
ncbi:hypothetical protein [Actinopolymorpha rutila]|uniref:Uncharacterized protein n=1 Tax=Actinopolymorpha rutila TaxID=446787 RepID=A0A852ZK94_9ACTN|nr:hypothetical protein [Actinopolymorpha rutila]NYH88786.1 hypothetical protein [Actinopolymorpha rutila]